MQVLDYPAQGRRFGSSIQRASPMHNQCRLTPARIPFRRTGIDVGRTDAAAIEVYRTGKGVYLTGPIWMHIDRPYDPVVTAGIVVDSGPQKMDVVGPKPAPRLIVDGFPANTYGFVSAETVAVFSIVFAVAPVRSISGVAPTRIGSAFGPFTVLTTI